jgi:hypothetical protein
MATDAINMHKRNAMGKNVTGMKSGGRVVPPAVNTTPGAAPKVPTPGRMASGMGSKKPPVSGFNQSITEKTRRKNGVPG